MRALPRMPSVRELAANPPANVAVLPSAARRRVLQRWNAQTRAEARALKAEHAGRFPYCPPHARAVEPMAKAMIEEGRSAQTLLLVSMLQQMPLEDRRAVVERLAVSPRSLKNGTPTALWRKRISAARWWKASFAPQTRTCPSNL